MRSWSRSWRKKIRDNRFLRLIRNMLKAGYLEDWKYHETLSGCPQGGVVSPVLSNIYLNKLDEYVETVLIPQYTRGVARKRNPEYTRVKNRLAYARRCGYRDKARELRKQLRRLPVGDPRDPGYRRLRYSRYADDHLLGFIRSQGRSRGHQGTAGGIPARRTRARTVTGENADHPRPYPGGEVPRLRDHRPARRRENHRRAARGERENRAARPPGRHQGQARSLPAARQTVAPDGHAEPRRLRHRRCLRGRIPRHRPVLQARRRRLALHRSAVGRSDLDAEDPGSQAPVLGEEDGGPTPGQSPDTPGPAHVLRGQDRTRRQAPAGRPVRRDTPRAGQERGHHRPHPRPGTLPAQGTGHPAPRAKVRAVRGTGQGGRPPGPVTRQPRQAGTRPAPVGGRHGQEAAQDPRGLPPLPRRHPPRAPKPPQRHRSLESHVHRKVPAWFGGGLRVSPEFRRTEGSSAGTEGSSRSTGCFDPWVRGSWVGRAARRRFAGAGVRWSRT